MKPIDVIEDERWVAVPRFAGYSVSDYGRFKRRLLSGDRELRGKLDKFGYRMIGLVRDGRQYWFFSHRIVACAFLSPEQLEAPIGTFLTVNHRNRDKADNRLSNLELIPMADNARHWRKYPLARMRDGQEANYAGD